MTFATESLWHCPPHLRHVATIPREIQNSNLCIIFSQCGRKCKHSAFVSNFVVRPQFFFIFSVPNNGMSFPIPIANNFFVSLFFLLFTFAINMWHWKFVSPDVTATFVNDQLGIQRRGQDFDNKFVFEGVHSKQVDIRIFWETLDKAWR